MLLASVLLVVVILGWIFVGLRRPGIGRSLFYVAVVFGVIELVLNHC